jgi:hypothetical protein
MSKRRILGISGAVVGVVLLPTLAFLGGCIAEYTNPQLEFVSHAAVQNLH